jgi:cytochrome c peroxidase
LRRETPLRAQRAAGGRWIGGRLPAVGLLALLALAAWSDGEAAADGLAPGTPAYFGPVYESLKRAPRPHVIYRQGGFPSVMRGLEVAVNQFGRVATFLPGGGIATAGHPFFQALGTNGRSCATCHQPPSGMSISLRNIKARFRNTGGADPLFAPVDGADCPGAVAAAAERADAHSLLLTRGTIRIPLPWPPRAGDGSARPVEFDLAIGPADDPPGCNLDPEHGLPAGLVSVYRRPPVAGQMNLKTLRPDGTGPVLAGSLMWDGREPSLEQQVIDATRGHAQAERDPTPEQVAAIVAFQTSVFAAQLQDDGAGRLDQRGGRGGPVELSRRLPLPAAAGAFSEYAAWGGRGADGQRASIARGQRIFNRRMFTVANVDGFNDLPDVGNPNALTTCSTCHNVANSGADFLPSSQRNVGVGGTAAASGGPAAAPDLPRFTLTCHADAVPGFQGPGPIVTNDPGLALVTGRCADIGRFTVPQLRALAAREPYFHDGSAGSLAEVVEFYDSRFGIGLSDRDKRDLTRFLAAL